MQQIGRFIPMTYAAQALRDIMIRNATFVDLAIPMLTLALTAAFLYGIGVLLYRRWVEK
jgi:ABC-type multidrug transport system permease subunit